MRGVGWLIMLGALAFGIWIVVIMRRSRRTGYGGSFSSTSPGGDRGSAHSAVARQPRDAATVVREGTDQFLTIEGNEVQVLGRGHLFELQSFGPDKSVKVHVNPRTEDKLREFRVLALGGRRLLVEHPMSEGGALAFFLYNDRTREMPPGFTEYLQGTPTSPGPAVAFAKSGQRADISIDAFGKSWKLTDIIWADVETNSGQLFVRPSRGKSPRIAALLGKNGDEWIFFADLRSGEGSDTVWIGQEFDPEVAIEV